MYVIQNAMPGTLALKLERGSICLMSNQSFDLERDGRCSRGWINSDPVLRQQLSSRCIQLVHDSEANNIPTTPSGRAVPSVEARRRLNVAEVLQQVDISDDPVIIELTDQPEPPVIPNMAANRTRMFSAEQAEEVQEFLAAQAPEPVKEFVSPVEEIQTAELDEEAEEPRESKKSKKKKKKDKPVLILDTPNPHGLTLDEICPPEDMMSSGPLVEE